MPLYGKLLEALYHQHERVSKEKGRHWSQKAVDQRQEGLLMMSCGRRFQEASSVAGLENNPDWNRKTTKWQQRVIINFRVHKNYTKRYDFSTKHGSEVL